MPEHVGVPLTPMEAFRQRTEPLWVAALGIHFVLLVPLVIRGALQLAAPGDQAATVAWTVYASLLVGYLPLIWLIARVLPAYAGEYVVSGVRLAIVGVAIVEFAFYSITASWPFLIASVVATIATILPLGYGKSRRAGGPEGPSWASARTLPIIAAGAFGWMCAGGLVSWRDATGWLSSSLRVALALVAVTVLIISALTNTREEGGDAGDFPQWWDYAAIAALAAFSFRTYPIIDFSEWSRYVGPIDQLRQGGRLLWDTPSPFGFLAVLVPGALPGSSWVALWLCQSVVFAVAAGLMYSGLRRLGSRWAHVGFAFGVTFTTLFFRPRDELVLDAAQKIPAAGAIRFVWCFVLLTFIASHYFQPFRRKRLVSFAYGGTAIWLASLLWSAESGFYCTAIWFLSYGVYLAQESMHWRDKDVGRGEIVRRLARGIALPFAALAATALVGTLAYAAIFRVIPDPRGYVEYVFLYSSGGLRSLTIDPSGAVWYLIFVFLWISTVTGLYLALDVRNPRLVVVAGLWGAVWSAGSYFVGASRTISALSLAPLLLFTVAIGVRLIKVDRSRRWHRLMIAPIIPAFAIPITMTLGHNEFRGELKEPQLPVKLLTNQLPLIDPKLLLLLREANARPADAYVRVDQARWMMPAWPATGMRSRVPVERSWLPRPYELIDILPPLRRQIYIDRDARSFPVGGWLVHSKNDSVSNYEALLAQIGRTRHEERRFENDAWTLTWMAIGPRASSTVPTAPRTSLPRRLRTNPDSVRR